MIKRFAGVLLFIGLGVLVYSQATKKPPPKTNNPQPASTSTNKYNDNVDDRMKGPKGEKIYIGPNGGRYYLKDGKKVYVEYNGNKKKKG